MWITNNLNFNKNLNLKYMGFNFKHENFPKSENNENKPAKSKLLKSLKILLASAMFLPTNNTFEKNIQTEKIPEDFNIEQKAEVNLEQEKQEQAKELQEKIDQKIEEQKNHEAEPVVQNNKLEEAKQEIETLDKIIEREDELINMSLEEIADYYKNEKENIKDMEMVESVIHVKVSDLIKQIKQEIDIRNVDMKKMNEYKKTADILNEAGLSEIYKVKHLSQNVVDHIINIANRGWES